MISISLLHWLAGALPLGFLLAALAMEIAHYFSPSHRRWLYPSASWLLWTGTGGVALAVASGFLLWSPAGPPLEGTHHQFLGFWVLIVFTVLSFWRGMVKRRADPLFTLIWLAAAVVVAAAVRDGLALTHPSFFTGVGS